MTTPLDLETVRRRFPGLAQDWILFDNAGGSQILASAVDRIADFLLHTNVQLGASYGPSRIVAERVHEARVRLASLVNAVRPEEIVMGTTATQLLQQLAQALAPTWRPGDEVVVTNFDHEANIGPWRALEQRGIVVREWRVEAARPEPDLADLEALLGPRTRLVCCTHVSNIYGALMPIPEIAARVHALGARLCVDGVAYAPHRAIDVQTLGADFYAFSLYKVYGPHHAVLYGRHDLLLEARNINHFFYGEGRVPSKLEPGNPNYELAWGCTAVVDYLEELGGAGSPRQRIEAAFGAIADHEATLSETLLAYLRGRNDVHVIGETSSDRDLRVPTISFVVDGRRSDEIVTAVDEHRIGIRFGDFHSKRLIQDLGLTERAGVVRVSMVHYNTMDEVERLVSVLDRVF